nr:Hpt domain-containing protein [Calothrix sp. MO_167.B42]
MIEDPSILEQGYIYFRSEAPDLIQTIEQELFNLSEERSTATVHSLMRATHTLKGGAANIGLEVINQIAHSLEDIFKALYNPEVVIDPELLGLLFQAYECLQLALSAELNGNEIDSDEILQRTASVCEQLQDKLGDAFSEETSYIPTSEELGFDITLSIFETGVNERIEGLAEILKAPPSSTELADYLSSNAEVFLGLAESLNLPGFQEISQNIINALQANPTQALQIAKLALADLQQSKAAVLGGDRIRGGEPSPAWQQFFSPMADPLMELLEESPVTLSTTQVSPEISGFVAKPLDNFLEDVGTQQLTTNETDLLLTTEGETQDISVAELSDNSPGNIWEEQLTTSETDQTEIQDICVAEPSDNSPGNIWE